MGNGKTILVVGRGGQVSAALAKRQQPSLRVRCFGRADGVDLANPAGLSEALAGEPFDLMINAAAYTAVDRAEDEEALATTVNGAAAGVLAGIAAERGVPFFHISTDYVFSGGLPRPYRESDPTDPAGAYGRSKLAGEKSVLEVSSSVGGAAFIFRTAWVYSADGSNFVKTMLRLGRERGAVSVVADQIGSPTAADDIADALLKAAEIVLGGASDASPGIYHLVGSGEISWYGFAAEIFKLASAAGQPHPALTAITTAEYPTTAQRPANSRLNTDKLARDFDIRLPRWQDSLSAVVTDLLSQN